MGDIVTTTTTNPPWECSASYEHHYNEMRHHVADVLDKWDAGRYNDWPTKARFISISEPAMTPAWFNQIVEIGRRGITHSVPAFKLRDAFPQRTWEPYTHDVYFIEPSRGNVRFGHAEELYAYIVCGNYVRVVHLGCDHPHAELIKTSNCYREYRCPSCGFGWGEDSSG